MGTFVKLFNLKLYKRFSNGFRSFSNLTYHKTDLLHKQPINSCGCKRTFFGIFKNQTKKQLQLADNIPENYSMIYRNTMNKYIVAAQLAVTASASLVIVAFILKDDYKNMSVPYERWSKRTKRIENETYVFLTFLILTVVSVQMMINRLPIRIYKIPHTPKYIMIFNGLLPKTTKRIICERGKIFHMEESGFLPWKNDRYLIQLPTEERRIILVEHYFRRPADLSIMICEQNDPDDYDEIEK